MAVVYTSEVVSTGDGRNGEVRSADGILDLSLTSPKEVGGSGTGTNPEQLFAAGYAACFHSALRLCARDARVPLGDDTVTARVSLEKDDGGYFLSVVIAVDVPGVDRDTAVDLVGKAHGRCPFSKAVKGNTEVRLDVVS
ncbi:organic hydroperoxide resistance protein [Actinacidiphila sp. ITFR-21]|uniref:organic hydroperoxide resistance protein n=1 Tax=Actinacidiphila sp. ITFR-21 TaxID=3075199 RepID=UPI002889FD04|nr:organic hydroperoxide resistance protein [Streptomyces sp. ITFR-21]WNI14293.1 organic hydroperoxide resistance protein [Streptomyces sp. ITFR-21]